MRQIPFRQALREAMVEEMARDLITRGRARKLRPEEYTGG